MKLLPFYQSTLTTCCRYRGIKSSRYEYPGYEIMVATVAALTNRAANNPSSLLHLVQVFLEMLSYLQIVYNLLIVVLLDIIIDCELHLYS